AADQLARAVEQLGFVGVVGTAAELDVVDRRLASDGMRLEVMQLQEAALAAAAAAPGHEGAAGAVPQPDRTLDLGRDVAGAAGCAPAGARPPRGGALLPGQVLDQGRERAVEDLRRIAAGNRVTQQVLRAPEFVVGVRARC